MKTNIGDRLATNDFGKTFFVTIATSDYLKSSPNRKNLRKPHFFSLRQDARSKMPYDVAPCKSG